jgi:hypothetical protein
VPSQKLLNLEVRSGSSPKCPNRRSERRRRSLWAQRTTGFVKGNAVGRSLDRPSATRRRRRQTTRSYHRDQVRVAITWAGHKGTCEIHLVGVRVAGRLVNDTGCASCGGNDGSESNCPAAAAAHGPAPAHLAAPNQRIKNPHSTDGSGRLCRAMNNSKPSLHSSTMPNSPNEWREPTRRRIGSPDACILSATLTSSASGSSIPQIAHERARLATTVLES